MHIRMCGALCEVLNIGVGGADEKFPVALSNEQPEKKGEGCINLHA